MKPSLVALFACCAISSAAFASHQDPAGNSAQALRDRTGTIPPLFVIKDDPGINAPGAVIKDDPGINAPGAVVKDDPGINAPGAVVN